MEQHLVPLLDPAHLGEAKELQGKPTRIPHRVGADHHVVKKLGIVGSDVIVQQALQHTQFLGSCWRYDWLTFITWWKVVVPSRAAPVWAAGGWGNCHFRRRIAMPAARASLTTWSPPGTFQF